MACPAILGLNWSQDEKKNNAEAFVIDSGIRHKETAELLIRLLAESPNDVGLWIRDQCGSDQQLRQNLTELWKNHNLAGENRFLEDPVVLKIVRDHPDAT